MDETSKAPLISAWDLLPATALSAVRLWLQHWLPLLPDWIPSHWNAAGVVNGWMGKGRFFAFAAWPGIGIWALLFLIGAVLRLDEVPRRQLGARAVLPLRGLLPFGFILMAGGFAPMAAFYGGGVIGMGVGLIVLCLIIGLIPVIRLARLAPPIPGATTDDYRWGGLIYWNGGDERVWVPKRLGLGWTLNFGRPVAWVVMALLLILPLALAAGVIIATSH
ncbi:MAG TPA: DUF5808 domain-containing protein [Holophagaceae bacterium]|jgi:uncharacterized membrane protein|nr:DUF5808 domain-containing protein [Holophagaceae bacterium]